MNRDEAKKLAEITTGEQISKMMLNAQKKVKDWTIPSRANKGISLGASFNIFSKIDWSHYGSNNDRDVLMKTNAIWCFGEYLPNYSKPEKKVKAEIKTVHQEPNFIDPFDGL